MSPENALSKTRVSQGFGGSLLTRFNESEGEILFSSYSRMSYRVVGRPDRK